MKYIKDYSLINEQEGNENFDFYTEKEILKLFKDFESENKNNSDIDDIEIEKNARTHNPLSKISSLKFSRILEGKKHFFTIAITRNTHIKPNGFISNANILFRISEIYDMKSGLATTGSVDNKIIIFKTVYTSIDGLKNLLTNAEECVHKNGQQWIVTNSMLKHLLTGHPIGKKDISWNKYWDKKIEKDPSVYARMKEDNMTSKFLDKKWTHLGTDFGFFKMK